MYSIVFTRWYKDGKPNRLAWYDGNKFNNHIAALIHAMDMVNEWREKDNELITFEINSR